MLALPSPYYLAIGLKLLARKPDKIFIFIRDLAIPIILIISVTSIINSFNDNIIFLSSLAGEDKYLALREDYKDIGQSFIPNNLTTDLRAFEQDITDILLVNQLNVNLKIREPYQKNNLTTENDIIGTDLSKLSKFWEQDEVHLIDIDINNLTKYDAVIGEGLANSLNIVEENLPLEFFVKLNNETNSYLPMQLISILKGETIYSYNILTDLQIFSDINNMYLTHSNYLILKINQSDTIEVVKSRITDFLEFRFPEKSYILSSARGTNALLNDILFEIVDKLRIFNFILITLVLIRLFQAIQWLNVHYELDFAYLKIIGQKRIEILVIVLIIGQIIGNFSMILALPISLLLPHGISLFLALITNQVFIPEIPTVNQIFDFWIIFNLVFLFSCLIPGIQISLKPIKESIVRKET